MNTVFLDIETTGLDPQTHDVVEIAWSVNTGPIRSYVPWHTLDGADPKALSLNRYFERDIDMRVIDDALDNPREVAEGALLRDLRGALIVGSNPAFDTAFLRKKLGVALWHHRLFDVACYAAGRFGWAVPRGMADLAEFLREAHGKKIPEPDHTAEGDVRTLIAVYLALTDGAE